METDTEIMSAKQNTKTVLVTGGCGYIGSHILKALKTRGYNTVCVDRNRVEHTLKFADEFIQDNCNGNWLCTKLGGIKPDAVIHCAANSLVGPSVTDPRKYYENNVTGFKFLLDCMLDADIKNIVFSSSSSVYGIPTEIPVTEDNSKNPLCSYGKSKLVGEMLLEDYNIAYNLNSVSFRYFNVCGADPAGELGQLPGATHLIARIMESVLYDDPFYINGNDYPTSDGTCVRDYVHVTDIARANVDAVEMLLQYDGCYELNLGAGRGYSVLDIINNVEKVLGTKVKYTVKPRRPGDATANYASIVNAQNLLSFSAKYNLEDMIRTALAWYQSNTYKKLREQHELSN